MEQSASRMESMVNNNFENFFSGKKVLVTGHTGFKGSWLSIWLTLMGAKVIGYSLPPATKNDNFLLCNLEDKVDTIYENILNKQTLDTTFENHKPDIVFHLAAQPNVRYSYDEPIETFNTNVIGTVNVLESFRKCNESKVCIIITTDKCYENMEQIWGYRETDRLGGFDPYSASKGCAELATSSYVRSYFLDGSKKVATVRAGNVVGGGDWTKDRIIPDCVTSFLNDELVTIRNPNSVRPWQFVLEPLYGYLLLAYKMFDNNFSGAWNFGPDFDSIVNVGKLVNIVLNKWYDDGSKKQITYFSGKQPHEANLLSLDCTKAKTVLGWKPILSLDECLDYTIYWYKNYKNSDVFNICKDQILDYTQKLKLRGVNSETI